MVTTKIIDETKKYLLVSAECENGLTLNFIEEIETQFNAEFVASDFSNMLKNAIFMLKKNG